MTRDERAAVEAVVETLPATVESWSDGLAALDPFDLVEVRRPLTSLSSSGGGRWWVGPREVRPELAEVAGDRRPLRLGLRPVAGRSDDVPQCGWGCTPGAVRRDVRGGLLVDLDRPLADARAPTPIPTQGYVHEWLHQVESVYRGLGVVEAELPPLHDAGAFTSTRPADEPPYGRIVRRVPRRRVRGPGRPGIATG